MEKGWGNVPHVPHLPRLGGLSALARPVAGDPLGPEAPLTRPLLQARQYQAARKRPPWHPADGFGQERPKPRVRVVHARRSALLFLRMGG